MSLLVVQPDPKKELRLIYKQPSGFRRVTHLNFYQLGFNLFAFIVRINISTVFVHRVYMRLQGDGVRGVRCFRTLPVSSGSGGGAL